jgi:hypothetical protein
MDLHWKSQYPAMSSFVSAKGPSTTVRRAIVAAEDDPSTLGAGEKPFSRQQDAGLHQLLVVVPHIPNQLLPGHHAGLGILVSLY